MGPCESENGEPCGILPRMCTPAGPLLGAECDEQQIQKLRRLFDYSEDHALGRHYLASSRALSYALMKENLNYNVLENMGIWKVHQCFPVHHISAALLFVFRILKNAFVNSNPTPCAPQNTIAAVIESLSLLKTAAVFWCHCTWIWWVLRQLLWRVARIILSEAQIEW